ncbi:MAG: hypothetical protein RL754_720 [Bacteroidota bacterium]
MLLLYGLFLAFSWSCTSSKSIPINVPLYEVQVSGSKQNPNLLLFLDHSCAANDSIIKSLRGEYCVFSILKSYPNSADHLNSDHPLNREKEGFEIYQELSKRYRISSIGATGFEVYSTALWVQAVPSERIIMYPYFTGSLEEYLLQAVGTGQPAFSPSLGDPLDLLKILSEPYPGEGFIHRYPVRYLHYIWKQHPEQLLISSKEKLVFKPIL